MKKELVIDGTVITADIEEAAKTLCRAAGENPLSSTQSNNIVKEIVTRGRFFGLLPKFFGTVEKETSTVVTVHTPKWHKFVKDVKQATEPVSKKAKVAATVPAKTKRPRTKKTT